MNTTGLPELWHSALAILSRQQPFAQIMIVTLAALFVVMALEGFRSSLRAIWHGHRAPAPPATSPLESPVTLTAPAGFASRSFTAKARATRPKALDQSPRQFRTQRPTIRRAPAEESRSREMPSGEEEAVTAR